jgi:hypothetical protein
MRSLPSHKSKPKSNQPKAEPEQAKQLQSKTPLLMPVISLVAILGLAFISLLPRFTQSEHLAVATKQAVSPTATTVTLENKREQNGNLHIFWSIPVSQAQFWFDNSPVAANCDPQNCTVLKHNTVQQIYFRWLDSSDNQWYYFQCNGDYKGQFKGISYATPPPRI